MTRREHGSASIELLGMFPLALIFGLIALQVGSFMWAVTSTNEAVRQGVRAESLGQDGCRAARDTLTSSLTVRSCSAPGGGELGRGNQVRLVVDVPILRASADFVPTVQIERTAYLP